MSVKIIIGDKEEEVKPQNAKLSLDISRTVDGDYMIKDHNDIDVVVMVKKMKIIALPKDMMSDLVYGTENRLFKFLTSKGLVDFTSVQSGSVYGSLEARVLPSEETNSLKLLLLNIEEWIDSERPYFDFIDKYEDMQIDRLTDPDREHSTELGEIPHDEKKGAMHSSTGNSHHWRSYTSE